jgi:diaminopimelate decarboxylase
MDPTELSKKSLSFLGRRYGTPLFVFSEGTISENLWQLKRVFGSRIKRLQFFYAVKASSNLAVLQVIRRSGVNAEIASEGEMFLALMAGFKPEQIIFNGPAKSDRELELSARLGLAVINLDSMDELRRLYAAAKRSGKTSRISFRVRPDVAAGADVIQTGTHDSKFGIAFEDSMAAYEAASQLEPEIQVAGIHAHVGSQNTSLESWRAYVTKTARLAKDLERKLGVKLQHLNLGGGLPATYGRDKIHRPLPDYLRSRPRDEEIAGTISSALKASDAGKYRIFMEPGRRIVADSAVLITKVISTKQTRDGEKWIYVDAGFNILPSSRILKWYYQAFPIDRESAGKMVNYRVAGPLCDGNDLFHDLEGEQVGKPLLPRYRKLPAGLADGNMIGLMDVGAYNLELTTHFNGRLRPGAVMISAKGRTKLICSPETNLDLVLHEPHSKTNTKRVLEMMDLG